MKIIVSGFEAFGDLDKNPTTEILRALDQKGIEGVSITTIILPVVYKTCFEQLDNLIDKINPDAVLCLGVAAGRTAIQPERIGINLEDVSGDGQQGDNKGDRPEERTIIAGAPDAYFSSLPNRQISKEINELGLPSIPSNSAGTYICNTVLYRLMHKIKSESRGIPGGFIHVPATPDMVLQRPDLPSMNQDDQVRAIQQAIQVIRRNHRSTWKQ